MRIANTLLAVSSALALAACHATPDDGGGDDGGVPAVLLTSPAAPLTTRESGGAALTLDLVLQSRPSARVTIDVTSSVPTEGVVNPASAVFEPSTWSKTQTLTVSGVNDALSDLDQPYQVQFTVSSNDSDYDGFVLPPLSVTNIDDDLLQATPASPATLSFGSVKAESVSDVMTWSVHNTSPNTTTSPLTGLSVPGDFVVAYNGCAAGLAPLGTCQVKVRMTPFAPGAISGVMTLTAATGGVVSVGLDGSGTAVTTMTAWPRYFDYGNVALGNASPHTFLVYNGGSQAISGLAFASGSGFAVSIPATANACTGSLNPFAFCEFVVTFTASGPTGFVTHLIGITASPGQSTSLGVSAVVTP